MLKTFGHTPETLSNLEILGVILKKANITFLYDQSFRTHAEYFLTHSRNLYQSGNFQTHTVNFRTHEGNFEQSGKFSFKG